MKTNTMHHFYVEDAIKYGVEKAIILANFKFWLDKNKEKGSSTHYNDGFWWTFNSSKSLSELLPYLKPHKIQRLLKQMEEEGILITGNYNKTSYDRTKWYTLPEYWFLYNCKFQYINLSNGKYQTVQPIPYINTDGKKQIETNPEISRELRTDNDVTVGKDVTFNIPFSDFWKKYDYPQGDEHAVKAKWESLSDEERSCVMTHLDKYIPATPDKTYRKYPMTYLNTESWKIPAKPSTPIPPVTSSKSFKEFDDTEVHKTDSEHIHWYDLKQSGKQKHIVNTNTVVEGSAADSKINDFLAMYGSKSRRTA